MGNYAVWIVQCLYNIGRCVLCLLQSLYTELLIERNFYQDRDYSEVS